MSASGPPLALVIERATPVERSTLTRLLQLYLYDFSEFEVEEAEVDDTGHFQTSIDLMYYLELPDWHAFLFRVAGRLAGFALIRRLDRPDREPNWSMDEFFILRRYRRRGLGRQAARALFAHLPGRWEVGELHANTGAIAFWRRVIGEYTTGRYSEQGADDRASPGPLQVFRTL